MYVAWKKDFLENLHALSCFILLKSVILISCVLWILFHVDQYVHMLCSPEYAGHGQNLVENLELSEWGAIVIVSGDGLIYEVGWFTLITEMVISKKFNDQY